MKRYTPQDFEAIVTRPSVWIVDNLLRCNRKRVSLLCGSPHAGKSTLARQLALAVVHGDPFLGRETLKSKVIYWQSEESDEDAKEDFKGSGMRLDDGIIVLQPEPKDNNLTELSKAIEDNPEVRLVIVETLDDFLQMGDLTDNTEARKAFEKFDAEVVSKFMHRCAFLVLHHFKKSDEQKGLSLNKILGATVIAGKTDAKIYMYKAGENDPRHILSAQIRKGISIEKTYLVFDKATQSSTLGQTVTEEQAEARKISVTTEHGRLRQRCIDSVVGNPGQSKTWHADKLGGKRQPVFDMFKILIEKDGVVVSQSGGATNSADLLYIKGRAPEVFMEPVKESYTCADDNCTTQVLNKGDFCSRHKLDVVPTVPVVPVMPAPIQPQVADGSAL